MKFAFDADPETMKNCGGQIFRGVGRGLGQPTMLIGASDNSARLDSATGKEAGEYVTPVMATGRKNLARSVSTTSRNW